MQQREDGLEYLPHNVLVSNLHAVIKDGLDAPVKHPKGSTARQVCTYLYRIAEENASPEEKKYLGIVKRRIAEGNLSDLILKEVTKKTLKTDLREAIFTVYTSLANCLEKNKIYS